MNTFLDGALVGIMIFTSVVYATISLGPKTLRRRVLLAISSLLGRGPKWTRLGGAAQRLASTAQSTKGSCGGCDNCGSATTAAPQPPGEMNIPLSKIGRRRNSTAQR